MEHPHTHTPAGIYEMQKVTGRGIYIIEVVRSETPLQTK
jgi:hypothetical protein